MPVIVAVVTVATAFVGAGLSGHGGALTNIGQGCTATEPCAMKGGELRADLARYPAPTATPPLAVHGSVLLLKDFSVWCSKDVGASVQVMNQFD